MSDALHNPCATCGACCRSYIVPVCGYDVWLISTRQRLGPEQFLVPCPQEPPRADGFLLDPEDPPYGLALDKRGRFHPNQPCVFLIDLKGGNSRCGIYEHRPVVCQAYPMTAIGTVVAQFDDALCPPGSWPPAAVRRPAWREAIGRRVMQFAIYEDVVSRWNARVIAARTGAQFSLYEYYDYLINAYNRLDLLNREVGADALAEIQRTWGMTDEENSAQVVAEPGAPHLTWPAYRDWVRWLLAGFYAAPEGG
jgi:Fe-S-cluster containining protein